MPGGCEGERDSTCTLRGYYGDDRLGHTNHCNDQHTHFDNGGGRCVCRWGKAVLMGKAVLIIFRQSAQLFSGKELC